MAWCFVKHIDTFIGRFCILLEGFPKAIQASKVQSAVILFVLKTWAVGLTASEL